MKQLQAVYQQIKNRFTQLADREKKIVVIGGVFLLILIAYTLIWSPVMNHLDDMRKKIKSNQQLVQWMQSADKTIDLLKKSEHPRTKPISVVDFLSTLKKGVQDTGLTKALSELRQASNDSVDIHFQNVNFDKAIAFLSSILKAHDVHVAHFVVAAQPSPGLTNIDMVMKVNLPTAD